MDSTVVCALLELAESLGFRLRDLEAEFFASPHVLVAAIALRLSQRSPRAAQASPAELVRVVLEACGGYRGRTTSQLVAQETRTLVD